MSSKTHPRLVGFFVLGAVALVLGAVVILGSGDLLRRTDRFTVFFPGSVRGLGKGSMVSFRGIKIGEVRSVHGIWTSRPDEPIQIEVELELFQSVVDFARGVPQPDATTPEKLAKALLDLGIRARLASTSPLTGQKYVDLDFAPNDPPRFVGLPSRYPELPTTPSSFEKLGTRAEEMWSRISELPVEKMLDDLGKTLQSLRKALEAPELEGAIGGVHRSADELATTLRETRAAVADLRRVLEIAQGEGTATAAETRQTMAEARRSIARAEKSLETLDAMMRGADTTRLSAEETLAELRQALQAIGGLVDYVQAHPEAVVLGKERAGEKK